MARKPALGADNGRGPTAPDDIAEWMALRDELVMQLRHEGTWQPAFAPLLAEFAEALRMAAKLRAAAEAELFTRSERSGRAYLHPAIPAADVEIRRAALLLSRIVAMAKLRPAAEEQEDFDGGLADLDAETVFSEDPAEDARIRRQRLENMRASMK